MNDKGWECPKCGRVYAPWVSQCSNCVPKTADASAIAEILSREGWEKMDDGTWQPVAKSPHKPSGGIPQFDSEPE